MTCITHHLACKCREEKFRKLEEENRELKDELKSAKKVIAMINNFLKQYERGDY